MKLYIKFMVSLRCKMIVKEELHKFGLKYVAMELGVVEVLENITEVQREQLRVVELIQTFISLLQSDIT